MVEGLLRKLSGFFRFGDDAVEKLTQLCSERRVFAPRERIATSCEAYQGIFLVRNGWAVRSRLLENGGRQIVNVGMPGDFLCLNAMIFARSDFDIIAKTEVTADVIDPARLRTVLGADPDLAAAIFWVTAHEESILAERIVSLGRRSVRQRTAHVLCEFISRLEIIDEAHADELLIPLTQEDFSDILGTSLVHTNKTLRSLDRDGIIRFRQRLLQVSNRSELERVAGFERGYMHFTRVHSQQTADAVII